ncbi:hypothetical protein OUZ56_011682 [Daphnia magna]|uniref:BEN domain-containing protein n=1 Tax=Daphnia magna TaxID=35525 RepID=A0ABQ9Z164_9CRUS|nr:hypothetical protein OUZ56_011682 [Daphnia magna]
MADQNSNSSNKQDFVLHILVTFTDGTFGISTGKLFFKPKLPQKSDIEDWVWPAGVDFSTSWNLLDYEGPADCNKSKQSLHNGSILKSGTIMFYSESIDEIRKERDKLILQGNESKYLKSTDGKQKFEYPTKCPPNYVTPEKKVNKKKQLNLEKTCGKAVGSTRNAKKKSVMNKSMTPPVSESDEQQEKPKSADLLGKRNQIVSESNIIEEKATSCMQRSLAHSVDDDNLLSSPLKSLEAAELNANDSVICDSTTISSHNSEAKLSKYEKKIEILQRENQSQKEKISINEMDLEIYYYQLASKELQILELNEKIAELENEQPMVLIKGQHLHLQDSSASAGNNALTSVKSNTAGLHTGTRMLQFNSDVMVSESCIRKIAIALVTDQMTDTCRNRIAALILDDLYTIEELANMSLSGRKCPGQDRVAKPKLPPEIISAIHSRP